MNNIHLFKYPPLAYFVLGINFFLVQPFLTVISNYSINGDIHNYFIWYNSAKIFQELFFLKLIYLFSDILILIFICKMKADSKNKIIKIWAINPILLFLIYMYAQFDVLAVLFIVVSIYCFYKDKNKLGFLFLGIGGMLKHFPFLLLPLYIITIKSNIIEKIKYFMLAVLPYILFAIPFYITSNSFKSDVIFNSVTYMNSKLFLIMYLFIIIISYSKKKHTIEKIILLTYVILSLYLILSNPHPQFFLWIIPFLLYIITIDSKFYNIYIILTISFFIYINYWGRNSTTVLLFPLNSQLKNLPSLTSVLNRWIDFYKIMDIFNYLIKIVLAYSIIRILFRLKNKKI